MQRLASGVRRLRQTRGKPENRRTHDHDPSTGAGSLLPRGPTSVSVSRSSGLSTGFGSSSRRPASLQPRKIAANQR
ncbi:hypothetical protein NDU88_000836 [Pleurodeles waltl]|uniref:Uncharacterized protein n=1 Tax=Pleurodeles waltl TaxID=8319 RepID=A0AAV7S5P8_PLEWA|nr:hypothetical protein NDU88_000836 [Pleurodeles waltl]